MLFSSKACSTCFSARKHARYAFQLESMFDMLFSSKACSICFSDRIESIFDRTENFLLPLFSENMLKSAKNADKKLVNAKLYYFFSNKKLLILSNIYHYFEYKPMGLYLRGLIFEWFFCQRIIGLIFEGAYNQGGLYSRIYGIIPSLVV